MKPISPEFGDLRSHCAGHVEPGYGYGKDGSINGNMLTLEVRTFENKFRLSDRQYIARLLCGRLTNESDKIYGESIGSSFVSQRVPTLSPFFKSHSRSGEQLRLFDD